MRLCAGRWHSGRVDSLSRTSSSTYRDPESARSTPQRPPWHSVSRKSQSTRAGRPSSKPPQSSNARRRTMAGPTHHGPPTSAAASIRRFNRGTGAYRAKQRTASRRRKVRIRCSIQRIAAVRRMIDRERLAPIADQEEPAAAASYTGVAGGSRRRRIRTHESRRPFTETAAPAKTCRRFLGFMNNHELGRRRGLPRRAFDRARHEPLGSRRDDDDRHLERVLAHHRPSRA